MPKLKDDRPNFESMSKEHLIQILEDAELFCHYAADLLKVNLEANHYDKE